MIGRRVLAAAVAAVLLASVGACKPARPTGVVEAAVPESAVRKATGAREWVVARVAGHEVTFGEMEDVLDSLPVHVRMRYQAPERRRDFLEAYVHFLAFALEAESQGYGADPVVVERLKADVVDRYLQDHADLRVKSTDVTDEAVQAFCQSHPHELKAPPRRHVLHLLLADRAEGERIAFRVRKLLESEGGDLVEAFRGLVRKYTRDEATRATGGDLGWLPRLGDEPPLPESVEKAAEGLAEVYQVAGPVESPLGFHVLFLAAQKPALDETCEQARPRIVTMLMDRERVRLREALVEDLRKKGGVRVFDDVVSRVAGEVRAEQEAERRREEAAAGGAP